MSINRLRSGHTSLAESLFRHKIIDSPSCACGEAIQSPNHVFCQCPLLIRERDALLSKLGTLYHTRPFCIEFFLHILESKSIYALAEFIDAVSFRI